MGGNIEDVAFFNNYLPSITIQAPKEPPPSLKDEEHLRRVMVVKGIRTFRRLPGGADIEARRLHDVHYLVGALRYAGADDAEVFLLVISRRTGVDEGGLTRCQIAIADDALFHFLGRHSCSPNQSSG